jgi:hypothetical protein
MPKITAIRLDPQNRVVKYFFRADQDYSKVNQSIGYVFVDLDEHPELTGEIRLGITVYSDGQFSESEEVSPEIEAGQQMAAMEGRLQELISMLGSTDYKVTKCYEAQLLSQPLPYDIQALSQERQSWRDEINEIQAEIASLQTGGAN